MSKKYRVLERATEYPYKCVVTGKSRNVIDMGTYLEEYGYVYLHVSVIPALAEAFDLKSGDEVQELVNRSKLLDNVLATLEDNVMSMRSEIVRNVDLFMYSLTGSAGDSGGTDVDNVVAPVEAGTETTDDSSVAGGPVEDGGPDLFDNIPESEDGGEAET